MSTIKCIIFYVGHGSMFFTEVIDSRGEVEKIIIVDAGTTSDATVPTKESVNSLDAVLKRIASLLMTKIIICITHAHMDHYSFVWEIIRYLNLSKKLNLLEKIYIGSIINASDLFNYPPILQNIVNFPNIRVIILPKLCENQLVLWSAIERDVELLVLYNCVSQFAHYGRENDQSASFLIRHKNKNKGIFFTADSTGETFHVLNSQDKAKANLANIFENYFIYMTAPHHGSLDTMLSKEFIKFREMRGFKIYITEKLSDFLDEINLNNTGLIISAGVVDEHGHPNMFVAGFYARRCKASSKMVYFPVYIEDDSVRTNLSRFIEMEINANWKVMRSNAFVFTTVKADITKIDNTTQCVVNPCNIVIEI